MRRSKGTSLKLHEILKKLGAEDTEEVIPTPYTCTYARSDIKAARGILNNLLVSVSTSVSTSNEISSITEVPKEIEEI